MRVLVVEDDLPVASFLKKGLEAEHYAVDIAADGAEAQLMAREYNYDVAILDLNLPRADGLEVLKTIRATKSGTLVILLTARKEIADRVKGLDLGADDYLAKPFSFSELSARVRALLRRNPHRSDVSMKVADLEIDRVEHTVKRAGRRIELTPKEFGLLDYLMRNAGRRVTRAMIVEHVWNMSFDTMTNVVDVYINYVRRKIDGGFDRKLIHTVRGVGYQLGE